MNLYFFFDKGKNLLDKKERPEPYTKDEGQRKRTKIPPTREKTIRSCLA